MNDYEKAQPSGLGKPAVYALAESIAKQLDFKPGDDIDVLVKRLGGQVKIQSTIIRDPEQSGSLVVEGPNDFTIIVPSHTSPVRDRFTIAHELGHFFLHYVWRKKQGCHIGDRLIALRKGSDRVEWEANWFAGGFLMPENAFRQQFQRAASIKAVADHFGVSRQAAEIRAKQLHLI